jgi:hypothetical protein
VLVLLSACILASAGPTLAGKEGRLEYCCTEYSEGEPTLSEPVARPPVGAPGEGFAERCYAFANIIGAALAGLLAGFLISLLYRTPPKDKSTLLKKVEDVFDERVDEANDHGLSTCARLLRKTETLVLDEIRRW